MKLVIAKSALDDLQDIKLYYQEQGVPNVGQKMVISIFEKIQTLTEQPDRRGRREFRGEMSFCGYERPHPIPL